MKYRFLFVVIISVNIVMNTGCSDSGTTPVSDGDAEFDSDKCEGAACYADSELDRGTADTDTCEGAACYAPTGPVKKSIGAMIAGYKSAVTKQINEYRESPGGKVWHRNYYEHIIRNEHDLQKCREYIIQNPAKWRQDKFFK